LFAAIFAYCRPGTKFSSFQEDHSGKNKPNRPLECGDKRSAAAGGNDRGKDKPRLQGAQSPSRCCLTAKIQSGAASLRSLSHALQRATPLFC
jgi:hypothetical protein